MVDKTRRNAVKAIAVAGSVAALPAWAVQTRMDVKAEGPVPGSVAGAGLQVQFSDVHNSAQQLVTLSNTGSEGLTLRHIYPGIVSSANSRYDLNELLKNGQISIPAGESQVFRISVLGQKFNEAELPSGLTYSRPCKVATVEQSFRQPRQVTTTRSFFA